MANTCLKKDENFMHFAKIRGSGDETQGPKVVRQASDRVLSLLFAIRNVLRSLKSLFLAFFRKSLFNQILNKLIPGVKYLSTTRRADT